MNNNIVTAGNYEIIVSSFIGKPEYLIVYDKFFYGLMYLYLEMKILKYIICHKFGNLTINVT